MNRSGRLAITSIALCVAGACAPAEPPNIVRKPIGPEGGLITSFDGVLTIVLQPGALDRTYDVEIFPSDEPPVIFGPAYRVRPDLELEVDAEITYRRVFPNDPEGVSVAALRKGDYEEKMGYWRALPSLHVDVDAEEIIATDHELSLYYGMLEDGRGLGDGSGGMDGGPAGSVGSDSGGTSGSGSDTGVVTGSTGGDETTGSGPAACGDGDVEPGDICFAPGVPSDVGAGPTDLVIGDFDGDGNLDVATANGGATTVTVRLGDGRGGFGSSEVVVVGAAPSAIAAGDFDDDDDEDLVVAAFGDDAVVTIVSDGGTFTPQAPIMVGAGPVDLAVQVLDGDGLPDLVVLSSGAGELATFVAAGGILGTTGAVPLDAFGGTDAVGLVAGTFNDITDTSTPDGDAFAFGGGMYQGFDGTGGGALNAGGVSAALGSDLGRAWGGPIGGDDQDDIVVVDAGRGEIIVLIGTGMIDGMNSGFDIQPAIAVGPQPSDVVVADVTGDGDPDIIVAIAGDDTVKILERTGATAWADVASLAVGGSPSAIAAGDLNGDDVPDIIVANEADDSITVLLSDP